MKKNKGSKVKKFLEDRNATTDPENVVTPGQPVLKQAAAQPADEQTGAVEQPTATKPMTGRPETTRIAVEQQPVPHRHTASENQTAYGIDDNTILIKRTVRSGQCIQYDGNIVVLGDVNPGSELIASGNIVVMGALRGVVHAGATGSEQASVAAFRLQPTQLRIANHITRPPEGDYLPPDQPEIARIKDGVVVIEAYQISQDKQMKIC